MRLEPLTLLGVVSGGVGKASLSRLAARGGGGSRGIRPDDEDEDGTDEIGGVGTLRDGVGGTFALAGLTEIGSEGGVTKGSLKGLSWAGTVW